jgi:hypothetical protein
MSATKIQSFGVVIAAVYACCAVRPCDAQIVSGTVTNSSGQPVAAARVTLFTPTLSYFREIRSDVSGVYSISDVPAGTYQLGAAKRDFAYVEVGVTVGAGGMQRNFTLGPETEQGDWQIIGNTLPELFDATDIAILRPDGKVFFCHDTVDPVVFDPVTGQKTFPTGSWSEQGCMNGTLLADGRIIMVGGQEGSDPGNFRLAVRWVKTYNPLSNSWAPLPDLLNPTGRWYPGMARLADGSLLVMGGGTRPDAARTNTCERFDLVLQDWTYTGSLINSTEFPPCALLYTGEVLATWWPPQLYNVQSGQWRLTGNFVQPNRFWPGHSDHSVVVLEDGRVLALGVVSGPNGNTHMGEIYNPQSETWSLTSNPGLVRFKTEVVQLPDGRVLVAAGETEAQPPPVPDILGVVKWCDLYDSATNAWRRVADMNWFREYHAITLLVPDGRVITTGGTRIHFQYGPTTADIEGFVPPYLLRGVRPSIATISATTVQRGCALTLTITPATQITSVVVMGCETTTHWVSCGIPRRLVLPVEQAGSDVRVRLPGDANRLPLGHYMVFAMVDDIPSIARIIQIVAGPGCGCEGDINADGNVDLSDLAILLSHFGIQIGAGPEDGDGDADGDVDLNDLSLLLARFGSVC